MEGRKQQVIRRNISPPSAAAVTPTSAAAVSTEETDVEKQTRELTRKGIRVNTQSTWVLIVNGYHVFCAAPLYSTPYALMEGGWFGIVLLFVYWSCALYTSLELGMCMNEYEATVFTYQEVGEYAYGRTGHLIVSVNESLVVLAGCVESVTIICQAVVYALPGFIAFLDQQSNWTIIIGAIVIIIPLTLVCELVDVATYDKWLTVSGTVLNILVVACLVWLRYVNGVTEKTSTTEYVKVSSLPTSSGLFGYCFAGHPYLPILYGSIMTDNRDLTYIKIVYAFFLPSLLTYLSAATLGYSMFGANVESVYILNMPLDYCASQVAVLVVHLDSSIWSTDGIFGISSWDSRVVTNPVCMHFKNKMVQDEGSRDAYSYYDNTFGNFRRNSWYGEQFPSNVGDAVELC
ncbi:amino acid transporter AVT1C-like protein [Tanacetum coccineum]